MGTYSANSRFGGILDDDKRDDNDNQIALEAPSKVGSSRFGGFGGQNDQRQNRLKPKVMTSEPEQTAYPGLSNGGGMKKRSEPTVEELKKQLKRDNERKKEKELKQKSTSSTPSEKKKKQQKKKNEG